MTVAKLVQDSSVQPRPEPYHRKMPDTRQAITHKFEIDGLTGTTEGYLTVGLYEDGTPGEIFITIAKEGSTTSGLIDGFAMAISQGLQYGVPLAKIVEKNKGVRFQPAGRTRNPAIPEALSLRDYIARWLELKFIDAP